MRVKKAVFPVAGFGTRMLPATKAIPKEMLTLVNKPLIQYAVEEAIASGIEEIIFVTGRTKKALEDHFDINFELNDTLEKAGKHDILKDITRISEMVDIIYVRQKQMLGLGNAILCARDIVRGEPFAVILPDDIIIYKKPVVQQLIEEYEKLRKPVISLMDVDIANTYKYGIVEVQENINERLLLLKGMVEKPLANPPSNRAIIGRYIITPEVMEVLANIKPSMNGEVQLTDALNKVAATSGVYGYVYEGKRFDCGTVEGLIEATLHFAASNPALKKELVRITKELGL